MKCDLSSENILFEVRELISGIDSIKEGINIYCALIKQIWLSSSSQN